MIWKLLNLMPCSFVIWLAKEKLRRPEDFPGWFPLESSLHISNASSDLLDHFRKGSIQQAFT